MAGYISRGIKLSYGTGSGSSITYTDLTNLQEIPDLGGDIDTVETTVLTDEAHMYINGLKDYGDKLAFKFLYEPTQFATLQALTGQIHWKVSLPDGTAGAINTVITFDGEPSIKFDGIGVNVAMTYTLNITPSTAMVFA